MRTCIKCGFPGEDEEFKRNYKSKEELQYTNTCLRCTKAINKQWIIANRTLSNSRYRTRRNNRKARAVAYMGGHCMHCKGIYPPAAFDFHHLDPTTKDKDPGLMMSMKDEHLFKELDKCILLCANCHRIHHFENGYA